MKNENDIRRKLEDVYEHRLLLRMNRMMSRSCRNCIHGIERNFDIGEFGSASRWECGKCDSYGEKCGFECKNSEESIENGMINDISNPSVCGAKEPKIAMLMWILHDENCGKKEYPQEEISEEDGELSDSKKKTSLLIRNALMFVYSSMKMIFS